MWKILLNAVRKISPENPVPLSRNRQTNRNDFTQLWRQWPCLLKVKIHSTSYGFSQYRSYKEFDIKWDVYDIGLDFRQNAKLNRFWSGVNIVI